MHLNVSSPVENLIEKALPSKGRGIWHDGLAGKGSDCCGDFCGAAKDDPKTGREMFFA